MILPPPPRQWRTVGFWCRGQEVESAPLFPDFCSQKKSKMVDPKLISIIFKSEKERKKSPTFSIFQKFERFAQVYTVS